MSDEVKSLDWRACNVSYVGTPDKLRTLLSPAETWTCTGRSRAWRALAANSTMPASSRHGLAQGHMTSVPPYGSSARPRLRRC